MNRTSFRFSILPHRPCFAAKILLAVFCAATFLRRFLYYNIAMMEITDRSLALRTLQGDPNAFGILVRRYQRPVFNVCYRLLGERRAAEDLSQEAFIRAYQRLRSFDPERPFGPWMRRLAANLCYNQLNSRRPIETPLYEERDLPAGGSANPEALAQRNEQNNAVRRALLQLPPHYRLSLELRHFQELSYEEMAAELDLPLNTVKSHLFRARKRLAELLNETEY